MPEIVEVKIMSEYINKVCRNKYFTNVKKSDISKNSKIILPFSKFKIQSESYGKELKLILKENKKIINIYFNLGMCGYWQMMKKDNIKKHTHLLFECNDNVLGFVDPRRFGTWRIGSDWSNNRGISVDSWIYEMNLFLKYLNCAINHQSCVKIFNQPIYKLMLNQKYFNGIGNYLRSEILYRADINPFLPAKQAISSHLINVMKQVIKESYELGGGQLKDWNNPFGADEKNFNEWIQCYGKLDKIKDSGRRFWFNPKYRKYYE